MRFVIIILILFMVSGTLCNPQKHHESRSVIDLKGGPDDVAWVVQLSDLHFSVHHPQRAIDFKRVVGPTLSMINPSLVLITGDLTDGKSKDLLTMKQNEEEWIEYHKVMEDVIEMTGLDRKVFYDLRGNHDNFGVPVAGGAFDFFEKYSINAGLRRVGNVHSVTLQSSGWKYLFVGFDSTMNIGLRGPTNLFGHPTDQLLADIDSELSQWDSESMEPVTKISFGHFPLSFSAPTDSGKSLKDVFLKHYSSAYLCGHLHARFGKNLKRHHQSDHHFSSFDKYFQLNMHHSTPQGNVGGENCSTRVEPIKEFWEWEMGDWMKRRTMRVLAIDAGHVSFVDLNFTLGSKKTIILPTFPLDSRFMQRIASLHGYDCSMNTPSYKTVRALVFSEPKIISVVAKIYDSSPGYLNLVMEATMKKHKENGTRGDLYTIPWNWKAFADPSPDRFWLQIEATDISGRSSFSQLRPFSINGITAKLDWTWREFLVMGCQWASLYHPILWSVLLLLFSLLLIPKAFLLCSKKHYLYKNFSPDLNMRSILLLALVELSRMTAIWNGLLIYLVYLIFFPWFYGQVFTEKDCIGYMTHKGWSVRISAKSGIGWPDVMVIVLPHLCFVVLPAILVISALAAEKVVHRKNFLLRSGKKEDDYDRDNERDASNDFRGNKKSKTVSVMRPENFAGFCSSFCFSSRRWMRKLLLLFCLVILWKHLMVCRNLVKAYDINPFLHSPAYCFPIPLLLAFAVYKTMGV